ncbi:uncharacterized protein CC84DRAFT_1178134 [Paraphaeosphaeria sporulosa]|uniref:Uncharacterized protein n=1 Tax=Paraphaeosphaeria sporulosa TaxID=1460663 RepID=A0A177CC00_9PLEO|nr:uncharacterized protein CC84DRAFT_1178134 [Paraphaeosphaeria sporulosa]OAG04278.1 hypothetical protein CC84DRAFT_1178134 [Paraphaeosphaeria sporulosa]
MLNPRGLARPKGFVPMTIPSIYDVVNFSDFKDRMDTPRLGAQVQQESIGKFLEQQAVWAAQDGTRVIHTSSKRMCLSADKPLLAGLDTFCFEITNNALGDEVLENALGCAIRLCTVGALAIQFPSWPPWTAASSAPSWGYRL